MSSPNRKNQPHKRRRNSQLDQLNVDVGIGKNEGVVSIVRVTRMTNGDPRWILVRVPGLAQVLESMFGTDVRFTQGVYRFNNNFTDDNFRLLLRDTAGQIAIHIRSRSYKMVRRHTDYNSRTSVMEFQTNLNKVSKQLF